MRATITAVILLLPSALAAQNPALLARADSIFARFAAPGSPGCVLGVARNGSTLLERAWGLADIERSVPLSTASILEAGSVSKQFTAALILLLAKDGVLSLDDDVRRWLPELPAYATPVTLRHMIHHTSGFRDWGAITAVGGWPRNTRALTHAHVLGVASRLRELNFPAGSEYDYSNTNYNLLAMVAERAGRRPFPELTRERLFQPLGMTSTSWRDDALRVVPNRALSYSRGLAGWRGEYAIENITGNCCLLTTVADLLKWNEAIDADRLGIRAGQERPYLLTGGRTSNYAAGLQVGTFRGGVRFVDHDGATAGYRAYLGRFPDHRVSVAVLCNAGNANAEQLGIDAVAELMNLPAATPPPPPQRTEVPQSAIDDKAGLYRNLRNMQAQRFVVREGRLQTEAGIELVPQSETEFVAARGGNRVVFLRRGGGRYDLRIIPPNSTDSVPADRVDDPDTSRAALDQLLGSYYSEEADTEVRIERDSAGALIMRRAPDARIALRPVYRDALASGIGTLVFDRDGRSITGFRLTLGRVRNLRFVRRGD